MTTPAEQEPEHVSAADVREYAYQLIYPGFNDLDEVVEHTADHFEDSDAFSAAQIEAIVREAWASREQELAAAAPDADTHAQLTAAFSELEVSGIVCRMDFACCQNCGHGEIRDEEGADKARGYTFFHQQDSERLVDGYLYLAYGSLRPHEDVDADLRTAAAAEQDSDDRQQARREVVRRSDVLVGREVTDALRRHGSTVDWDGEVRSRIRLTVPSWRRQLPD